MRAPMAESTLNLTWMVLSGAVLGRLRDFEAMKTGKLLVKLGLSRFDACGERVCTRRQLDRTTDLKAGFEGVRYEADTNTYVRLDRGTALYYNIAANTKCRLFSLETHFLTHKDNGRVLPTESEVPVSKPLADLPTESAVPVSKPLADRFFYNIRWSGRVTGRSRKSFLGIVGQARHC